MPTLHNRNTPEEKTPSANTTNKRRGFRRRTSTVEGAQSRLRQFKQATLVAVAFTGFLLLIVSPEEIGYSQDLPADSVEISAERENDTNSLASGEEIKDATRNEAVLTLQNLVSGFYSNLPKLIVALLALVIAWLMLKLVRFLMHKTIRNWKTFSAISALTSISVWLLAIGVAMSVLVGDIRALVGSLGLVGLALSWSLQTPIESFTGWLINSFKRYYQVGDRIQVGEVFGDVYKIDFLTTTVWEIGAPYRQGFVLAEQPTGRLVTFPNNEILSGSIVNLTGDFPYVWDELGFAVANESDIKYSVEIVRKTAGELLSNYMKAPSDTYEKILKKAGLSSGVEEVPQVYVSATESWTELTVRYLVGVFERRKWKSMLTEKMIEEFNKPAHKKKIISVYPRTQVQPISASGMPVDKSSESPQ